jgi:small subunit ribosomal protein S1
MLEGQSIEQMASGNLPSPESDGRMAPGETRSGSEGEAMDLAPEPIATRAVEGEVETAAGSPPDPEQTPSSPPAPPAESAPSDSAPEPVAPEIAAPEPAAPEPVAPEPAAPEPAASPAMSDPAFAELLSATLARTQPIAVGDRLRAVVQRITDEVAFLDFGGPSEAVLDSRELRDAEGTLKVGVGERIDVTVSAIGDQVRVTRILKKTRDRPVLKEAWKSGATVEGKIIGTNKGGFDVQISGMRAFCPVSQIDRVYCTDRDMYVGQTLPFRIIEFKEGGRRVVVSRRVLMEEDRHKIAEATRARLQVGDVIEGTVVRLQPFGAFVDIGGIDGLVHVSELRYARISHPSEVVQVGDRIQVRVIGIEKLGDPKHERVSLSAKVLAGDPWTTVGDRLKIGEQVSGRVLRIMNYGAFIEVLPGIEGLLHVSEMPKRVRNPREAVSEGDTLELRILDFDPARKRLSLSARSGDAAEEDAAEEGPQLEVGMAIEGTVSSIKPYGIFVRITDPAPGKDGLLPSEETGLDRGADIGQTFAVGSTVKAEIIRIDDQGRIRLSVRTKEERAQAPRGPRPPRTDPRSERGGEGRRRRDPGRGAGGEEFPGGERGEDERRESKAGPQGLGIMANAFKRVLGR